ncbi:hypothetical protein [Microcoleus sp. B3-D7]|uniref:hypothetical protein n=1 Tax=Microcoleus sp. B3-D7 TaxID=2818659 RepID=UPI002FD3BCE8
MICYWLDINDISGKVDRPQASKFPVRSPFSLFLMLSPPPHDRLTGRECLFRAGLFHSLVGAAPMSQTPVKSSVGR